MTTAIKAQCDMRLTSNPLKMACFHCGAIASIPEGYDGVINSDCTRDAPPIEASAIAMARSGGIAIADQLLGRTGTRDQMLQARIIAECSICPHLSGTRCAKCGCYLKKKVAMANQFCPIFKWDDIILEHGTRDDIDAAWKWHKEPSR